LLLCVVFTTVRHVVIAVGLGAMKKGEAKRGKVKNWETVAESYLRYFLEFNVDKQFELGCPWWWHGKNAISLQ